MSVYIIAEMAWGHTGSLQTALEILRGAHAAGAQAIGIHLTDMPTYMAPDYRGLAGQTLSSHGAEPPSIYGYLQKINLGHEDWRQFSAAASALGLDLVAMVNDMESFRFSQTLPIAHYALSAASFLEFDLIRAMVAHNSDILLRIGGATLEEIGTVADLVLASTPKARITMLAGIQLYPTPIEDLHLASIPTLKQLFCDPRISFGLADHIDGDHPASLHLPALALPYGITAMEKHITTQRQLRLEDYEAALGLCEFKQFVDFVRLAERALGSPFLDYFQDPACTRYRNVSRKKVVAARDLPAGAVLTREALAFKRADTGAALDQVDTLLGRRLTRPVPRDGGVTLEATREPDQAGLA